MHILENPNLTLDNLLDYLVKRLKIDLKNMERVRKFYKDEDSFDLLMNRLIDKDTKRFEKILYNSYYIPNPWRVLYVVLDIVQNDGEEVLPFDTLTRNLPSRTIIYYGWTFSWVHGEFTLISIFNRKDELVYRF